MTRPTILDDEITAKIIEAVGKGASYDDAAVFAGVGKRTLSNWLAKGRSDRPRAPYLQFVQKIEAAMPKIGQKLLDVIIKSATEPVVITKTHIRKMEDGSTIEEATKETRPPDAKSAQWWLERRFHEQFGRRLEHAGQISTDKKEPDKPCQVYFIDPTDNQDADQKAVSQEASATDKS